MYLVDDQNDFNSLVVHRQLVDVVKRALEHVGCAPSHSCVFVFLSWHARLMATGMVW